MYSGFSKNNGSVVGDTSTGAQVDIGEAQDTTAAEESLICKNEQGEELVLSARIDPSSGDLSWCQLYSKEEVIDRTVGMSQMTSMLRDVDRNAVYERAIELLIKNFVDEHGRSPVVLDIGCGTGLLSMLAARHGADFVIGVEMFTTMANIAERVVTANDFGDKILIVNAKSSEIEDLPVQPDLLISELLDSALLGEGCMPAHEDAIARLLNPCLEGEGAPMQQEGTEDGDAGVQDSFANRVLPYSGLMYGSLVHSTEVKHMHDAQSIALGKGLHLHRTPVEVTDTSSACRGVGHLVPVHWSELKSRGARELSTPAPLLHANFTQTSVDATTRCIFAQRDVWQSTDIVATEEGVVHGVLLHWTLFLLSPALDPQRECTYSTAPGAQNWQDHWQQTVYPLPCDITVRPGDVVRVYAMHDSVQVHVHAAKVDGAVVTVNDAAASAGPESKRARCEASSSDSGSVVPSCSSPIGVTSSSQPVALSDEELPVELTDDCRTLCRCGWHMLCGPERFQAMCDSCRGDAWAAALDSLVPMLPAEGVVMDVSDGSLLGLSVAAKLREVPGLKVVSRECKLFSRLFFSQMADANELENVLLWDGQDLVEVAEFIAPVSHDEDVDEDREPTDTEDAENQAPEAAVDLSLLTCAVVVVVLSECSYYQLSALPAWQALSFHCQVQALRTQGLLHAACRVLPGKALLRAAVVGLPHLRKCHGLANVVCGFDHAELDVQQLHWHRHMYPYKLAAYQYTALSEAVTLGVIDCSAAAQGTAVESDLMAGNVAVTTLVMKHGGSGDGVAVWVDYELTPGNFLRSFENERFAHHVTVNIKFFPTPCQLQAGDAVRAEVVLDGKKMDFDYDFAMA